MLVLLPRAQRSYVRPCVLGENTFECLSGWLLEFGIRGINASQWHERNIKEVDVKQPIAVAGSTRR